MGKNRQRNPSSWADFFVRLVDALRDAMRGRRPFEERLALVSKLVAAICVLFFLFLVLSRPWGSATNEALALSAILIIVLFGFLKWNIATALAFVLARRKK